MLFALLNSQKKMLSKKLLNDLIRNKSFVQKLAVTAGKIQNPCQACLAEKENVEVVSPLKGKNVVYIGGYGGIGLTACKEIANRGIKNLTIMGRCNHLHMLEELQSTNRDLIIHFVNLNPRNGIRAIDAALSLSLEYMGHIDVLINSSSITSEQHCSPALDSDLVLNYPQNLSSFDEFKKNLLILNAKMTETTQTAIPLMSRDNGGNGGIIVNVSSVFGLEPTTYGLVYAAVKQDIIDTTRVFAQKFKQNNTGIRHIGICPGEYITYILGRYGNCPSDAQKNNPDFSKMRDNQCIKPIIEAIENATNGSVWISDGGKLSEIKLSLVDNLRTSFIEQLHSNSIHEEAMCEPTNLFTLAAPKESDLLPTCPTQTTPARNFSSKNKDKEHDEISPNDSSENEEDTNTPFQHENVTSIGTYDGSTAMLNWDKISEMREKAKDAIHEKYFTDEITGSTELGSENPAIVGSYTGPVKRTVKNIPSTTPTTNKRNYSSKTEDEKLTTGNFDDSTTVLVWDKITAMREKEKNAIHEKYFTNKITMNSTYGGENPAFVGSYIGPVKKTPKKLLPTVSALENTTRNFSAQDKENMQECECDSPYAECNTNDPPSEDPQDDETTPRLTWDKIAALRERAKSAIYQQFFTIQNEIPPCSYCGKENPAFVGSYIGPATCTCKATQTSNEVNELIKKKEEIPAHAEPTIEKPRWIPVPSPAKSLAADFEYFTKSDDAKPNMSNELVPTQLNPRTLKPAVITPPADSPLKGKNVALFGGFHGVPLNTCKEMAKKGINNLVILGGNPSTEQKIRSKNPNLNVNFIPLLERRYGRAGIEYALHKAVERMGSIDVLVHGSKIKNCYCPKMAISNCLRCVMDTEFCAVPFMSREYGHKGGAIINLSSIVGLEPLAFPTVHKAIKRGIINFTRTFAHQNFNARSGITHMAICPGENIMTTFGKYVNDDKAKELFKEKYETANECAKVIVTAIEKAENGTVWVIDVDKEKTLKLRKIWDSTA